MSATVEHELKLTFRDAAITQPVIWEMSSLHEVMFSFYDTDIRDGVGVMRIRIAGPLREVEAAERFLRNRSVEIEYLGMTTRPEPIPSIPRKASSWIGRRTVENRYLLTVAPEQVDRPVIWEVSRRYDITFDLRQAEIGPRQARVELLLRGPAEEVEGACAWLTEQGVRVDLLERDITEAWPRLFPDPDDGLPG